jgi:hypothetical protein
MTGPPSSRAIASGGRWRAGILIMVAPEMTKVRITQGPMVAILLAVALIVQPGVGMACARPLPGAGAEPEQSVMVEAARATPQAAAAARSSDRGAGEIAYARMLIALRLVELGFTDEEAQQAAAELTADDIAVLLENERMMQRAGDLSNVGAAYLIGTLIVVGIIILAANGSGYVTIN